VAKAPTPKSVAAPTKAPLAPTAAPIAPTRVPTKAPSKAPTVAPTKVPTKAPVAPTKAPVLPPVKAPSTPKAAPAFTPILINCGGDAYSEFRVSCGILRLSSLQSSQLSRCILTVDTKGRRWRADQFYVGGMVYDCDVDVSGTDGKTCYGGPIAIEFAE
jgi:hypothetical protein